MADSVDPVGKHQQRIPGYSKAFGARLRHVIGEIGGLEKTGLLTERTGEQVGRWRDGKSQIPFWAAVAMAEAANVSIQWLAWGGAEPGEESAADIDKDLLADCIGALDEALEIAGIAMTPGQKAQAIALTYGLNKDRTAQNVTETAEGLVGIIAAKD